MILLFLLLFFSLFRSNILFLCCLIIVRLNSVTKIILIHLLFLLSFCIIYITFIFTRRSLDSRSIFDKAFVFQLRKLKVK